MYSLNKLKKKNVHNKEHEVFQVGADIILAGRPFHRCTVDGNKDSLYHISQIPNL